MNDLVASDRPITIRRLYEIIRSMVVEPSDDKGSFDLTPNQVFFFVLVRLQKRQAPFQKVDDILLDQDVATLMDHTRTVMAHLQEWGSIVTALRERDEQEWELLRLQLERAVSNRFPTVSQMLRADGLQTALFKLFTLLDKMVRWTDLERMAAEDIIALIVETPHKWRNIYDFKAPFYAYAKQVAYNKVLDELRGGVHGPPVNFSSEEILDCLPAPSSSSPDDEVIMQKVLHQLKVDISRLLAVIQTHLTKTSRRVILLTLAGRPAFWRALEAIGHLGPVAPEALNFSRDADIADMLDISENSLRVHRYNAKKEICQMDPHLGQLLNNLLARRRVDKI